MTEQPYQHLERMKTRHGKIIFYYRPTREHRYRIMADPGTPAFDSEYLSVVAQHEGVVGRNSGKQPVRHQLIIEMIGRKIIRCRARDRARGMVTTIDLNWATEQLESDNYCCSLTGLPFQVGARETKVNPYSPSIDRIDSSKGYTPENSRLVLYAINAMMMDWGDEIFRHVVTGFVVRNLLRHSQTSLTSKKQGEKTE